MNKNAMEAADLGEDLSPILPDGWKEGDDLFAGADQLGTAFGIDEPQDEPAEAEENETDVTTEEPVTTTDGAEGDSSQTEEQTSAAEPDGAPASEDKPSRILKLKVNHQEREVDLNSLTDEELIEKLQKAEAFDALKDDQQKEKYRKTYHEQIDAGLTEAAARLVASHEVGGKEYTLEDPVEETETVKSPARPSEPPRETPDFKEQLKQLQALDPDCKSIPQEVLDAYMHGANLPAAYALYQVRQSQKTAEQIKKENQVLKQNAAAAAKAPVKGVASTGVGVKEKGDDPFLRGLNSEGW